MLKLRFFFDGSWLNRYPGLGKRILDSGHEIGSHGYSHPDMRGMKIEGIMWEIKETNRVIERELGLKPKVFTPPSGEYDDRVIYLAAKEDMTTILSTIDTEDWSNPGEEYILEKIKKNLRNGALILMHPTKLTVSVLPQIIKLIKENQFNIGTVSDLISMKHIR